MFRIALCDDQADELATMQQLLSEYANKMHIPLQVKEFLHPDELLNAIATQRYHVYLLDIIMPMLNGIELATTIRRQDREAQIVFVTTAPEYALSSFVSQPLNYLVKPIKQQELFDTLSLALARINPGEEKAIAVKTKEGTHVVSLLSIMFCEYSKHAISYHLQGGEVLVSVSDKTPFFENMRPLLVNRHFLRPHKSFVVNMSFVQSVSRQGFVLQSGASVPVAQKQYTEVRRSFLDYLFSED